MIDTEYENMKKWKDETLRRQKKLGKLRQDDDCHWYFIPENQLDKFDSFLAKLGLLEFYCEEWEEENSKFNNVFGEYMLNRHPSCYLMTMDDGQD